MKTRTLDLTDTYGHGGAVMSECVTYACSVYASSTRGDLEVLEALHATYFSCKKWLVSQQRHRMLPWSFLMVYLLEPNE